MGQNAVGFYWTLPVPWVGFTALPENIEEAARASRTIRYQVEAIRRYARDNNYMIIREEAFLEIEPDRGTEYVVPVLEQLEAYCRQNQALLLYVDFSRVQGWRSHLPMRNWSQRSGIEVQPIWPDKIIIDGSFYDPHSHFSDWRDRHQSWTANKKERVAKACGRAEELRTQRFTNAEISNALNAEKLQSASGRPWTEEMVRKLLARMPI